MGGSEGCREGRSGHTILCHNWAATVHSPVGREVHCNGQLFTAKQLLDFSLVIVTA